MADRDLYGVIIEEGPQNWQILQQTDGAADIVLAGHLYYPDELNGSEFVCARVVDEATGLVVCPHVSTTVQADRSWRLTLRRVPAGGLYRIETRMRFDVIKEKRGDNIHHIGVGDLFVIAGQSNAVGVGKDTIFDPPEPGIHMFRASGIWDMASHPLADNTGTRHPVNQETVQVGHSPWLSFARTLRRFVPHPIGLIPTALGGSPLSMWHQDEDGRLYRNMLDIVAAAGGKVRGILWHQGCNDANPTDAVSYGRRFGEVVADMRRDLGDGQLPVFTVQLNKATCGKYNPAYHGREWALIREAQRRAAMEIPGVSVAVSVDLKVCDGIHNSAASNMVIGERVARQALSRLYHRRMLSESPNAVRAWHSGEKQVTVDFENVCGRFNLDLTRLEQFPLCVEDVKGFIGLTEYGTNGSRITLELEREPGDGAQVHGAWEMNPPGILPYDVESYLPILAFYGLPVEEE